jgi:NitT/TauT family transport system ATP-binding protein
MNMCVFSSVDLVYGIRPKETPVLLGCDLTISKSDFVCILGRSGCGKSSLLSLIAGSILPSKGTIARHYKRQAMMFQAVSLLPWQTCRSNLEFGMRCRGLDDPDLVTELAEDLQIIDQLEKYPKHCSIGQQARVALARALAVSPDLLLLDEPFSALDEITSQEIREKLLFWHKKNGMTTVMVTHNPSEAALLGNKIVVMSYGSWKMSSIIELDDPSKLIYGDEEHLRRTGLVIDNLKRAG